MLNVPDFVSSFLDERKARRGSRRRESGRFSTEPLERRILLATSLKGDFDGSTTFTAADIDLLSAQIRAGPTDLRFDLTGDGSVNAADRNHLIGQIFGTLEGDVDLNGVADIVDLANVAENLNKPGANSWTKGDLTGDGAVTQADLDLLAGHIGGFVQGGPALLNKAVSLSKGLDSIATSLGGWLGRYDLTPAAGKPSALPVVGDQIATALQLATRSAGTVPAFAGPMGSPAALLGGLQGLGVTVTGTGVNGQPLEVRFTGNVEDLTGSGSISGLTRTLLAGIDPLINLSGNVSYDADLKLDLVLGVDDQGFYLSGNSRIDLDLTAQGSINGTYSLPLGGLGVSGSGQADADFDLGLVTTTPGQKVRLPQLTGNPASLWSVDADGTAQAGLGLMLTKVGQPTDVTFSGNWTIAVNNGVVGPVGSDVTTPDPGRFVGLLFGTLRAGVDQFLSNDVADLLNGIKLPMTQGGPQRSGPGPGVVVPGEDDFGVGDWFPNAMAWAKGLFADDSVPGYAGSAYTKGDIVMKTAALRAATGASGAGIKIGVISNGIGGLAKAQEQGDLPHVEINGDVGQTGSEGTAMLEIIHDIAPGADLLFSGLGNPMSPDGFIAAVDWLVERGADIIVDDISFLGSPFYENDDVALRVREIIENPPDAQSPVLFVTNAGNELRQHLHQVFDVRGRTLAGETGERELHRFGQLDGSDVFYIPMQAPPGQHFVALSWSETFADPENNYRILLIDPGSESVLGSSELTDNSKAFLSFTATNALPTGFAIAIERVGDAVPHTGGGFGEFSIFASDGITAHDPSQFSVWGPLGSAGSVDQVLFGHKALMPVITVGAVQVNAPDTLEPFSNWGPAKILNPDGTLATLNALDVVAPDGVGVTGSGNFSNPFFGTSAAAPHVAAAAALLWQLFPQARPNHIHDAINASATDIADAGYDRKSGHGRIDAVEAAAELDKNFDMVPVGGAPVRGAPVRGAPLGPPVPGTPLEPENVTGLELLQRRGFDVISSLTLAQLADLLSGRAVSGDWIKLRLQIDESDGFDPLHAAYQFDPEGIGTLDDLNLQGFVEASLRPQLDLTFGLDAAGFFFDSSSSVGGLVTGTAGLSGEFGPFDAAAQAEFTANPKLAYAGLGNGKLRLADLVGRLGNLTLSLGTVAADLQLDLALNFLDYVDVDPSRPNNPHGGDPFIFRGIATLTATQQQSGQFTFVWSDVGLANPNIDGKNYSLPVLVDDVIRFGRDQLTRPGGLFGPGGLLQQALNQHNAPLTNNPLANATGAGSATPDFDNGNLELITDIANWVSDHFSVDLLLDFDDIENWLNNDLPPGGTDIARVRYDLGDINLTPLANLAEKLDGVLPSDVAVGDILSMINAKLSGSLVFGVDTANGLYLVGQELPTAAPTPGGPVPGGPLPDASHLQLSFDINANLSNQLLSSGIFSLENALAKLSPIIDIILRGDDKLYLADLPLALSNLGIDLGNSKLILEQAAAKLFPRQPNSPFKGSVQGLHGELGLDGSLLLDADDVTLELDNALSLSADNVHFTFDPATPGATIATLTGINADLPNYPAFPEATIASLAIGPTRIDVRNLQIAGGRATIDNLIEILNPSITSSLTVNITPNATSITGDLTLGASEAALLPDLSTPELDGPVIVSNFSGNFDLATGAIRATVDSMTAELGDLIHITATSQAGQPIEFNISDDPASNVFSFPSITGTFPALRRGDLEPIVIVTGLQLKRDGSWRLGTVGVNVPAQYTLGIADLLPFVPAPTGILIDFAEDGQGNPDLNRFDLAIDGQFNIARLKTILGFTPIIHVGQQTFTEQSNGAVHLEVAVDSLKDGRLGLKNFGPLKLGIQDWKIGEVVFDGQITLGQFDAQGNLRPIPGSQNQIEGFLGFDFNHPDSKVKRLDANNLSEFGNEAPANPGTSNIGIDGGGLSFTGSYVAAGPNTTLSFNFDGSLKIKFKLGDLFELYGVGFNFDFGLTNPDGQFNPTFDFSLNNLSVDALRMAFGDLMVFTATPSQQGAPGLKLNFDRANPNDPIVEIGELGLHFPGLDDIGGSIENLKILPGGAPDLPGTTVHVDFGDFFSPENEVFDWLPFRVDDLGLEFKEEMFRRDGDGKITGIADPLAFSLLFSGGLDQGNLPGGFKFPLKATVQDLELDLLALKNGEFPIKDLGGVSIAIDPSSLLPNDSPFKVRGGLSFGKVTANNQQSIYGRLFGEFQMSDGIGGGLDLVISDRGPLLAKVIVPLAVPLGPTGLVLTQASGNIAFGVGNLRSVTDPMELVTDPLFFDPFDITDQKITAALQQFLTSNTFSWNSGFSLGLTGTMTTIATPGILNGKVSLGLNVEVPPAPGAPPALRFLGTGNMTVYGLPLGRTGLLLDLANPLAPQINFAFAAPAPDNPLGFLLPARANFALRLKTDGLIEAPLIGLRSFINNGANGLLTQLATKLQADHSRPMAQFLLDVDQLGGVSPAENAQHINPDFIKARFNTLIATTFQNLNPTNINHAVKLATAFYNEYSLLAGKINDVFTAIKTGNNAALTTLLQEGQQAFTSLSDLLLKSAFQAGIDAWAGFNPSLTISGEVQPLVFGFPLGEPDSRVDLEIGKDKVSFAMRGSLIKALKSPINQLSGNLSGPLLDLITAGFEDRLGFGFSLDLPDEVIDGLLTGGKRVLNDNNSVLQEGVNLPNLLLDAINPFANWEVLIEGDVLWLGVKLASVSGLLFAPQPFVNGVPNPSGLAALKIFDLDPDSDGTPNANLVKKADNSPGLIPVSRHSHYVNMMRHGGALLTGQLFMPAILKDPVGVFQSIDWTPPDIDADDIASNPLLIANAFDQFTTWISNIIGGLTADASYGRLQIYIPSPAKLFDLDTFVQTKSYTKPYGSDDEADGATNEILQPNNGPGLIRAPAESFQDLNNNGQFDGGDAFVDLNFNNKFDLGIDQLIEADGIQGPSGEFFQDLDGDKQYFAGGFFRDLGNGVYDGPEPSTDLNRNGVRDAAEPFNDANDNGILDPNENFTDANGDGVWNPAEEFTDLDGDSVADPNELFKDLNRNKIRDAGESFTDAGNGIYDPGESFTDSNNNGLRNANEPFVDAGNGVYDGPEPFNDANNNLRHDPGETFTDRNHNGFYDAGESFIDRGNGKYDGPAGSAAPRIALRDPDAILGELQSVFNSFYVEGILDAQLFSIRFGKAFVHLTPQGLQAELSVPWLLGGKAHANLAMRDLNFTEVLEDLMDSPLLADILDGDGLNATDIKTILNNANLPIPDMKLPFPVANFGAQISSAGLADWLHDTFGVPQDVFEKSATAGNANFDLFTPGFGDPDDGATGSEVFGGARLQTRLNLPGLVDNANFRFDVELFPTSLTSFLLPNFTAQASIDSFSATAGLRDVPGLVDLRGVTTGQPARISLSKRDDTLTGELSGKLALLSGTPAQAIFTAQGNVQSKLLGANRGLFGDLILTADGGGPAELGDDLYSLTGNFSLQLNTTGANQSITRGTGQNQQTINILPGLRVHADGSLSVAGFDLADGVFDLAVSSNRLRLDIDADLDLLALGSYSIDNSFLQIDGNGIAGRIDLDAGQNNPTNPFFDLDGTFLLEVNTTGSTVDGVLPGSKVAVTGATLHVFEFDFGLPDFSITHDGASGAYEFSISRALDYELFGLGELEIDYSLDVASDGRFEFDGAVAIDDMGIPLIVEITDASLEMHMDRQAGAGADGPITFSGKLLGKIVMFGLYQASFTSELDDCGGLTVHVTYPAPKSLFEPLTIIDHHLDLYINLHSSLLDQDIFDPNNVEDCEPPPPAQTIVRVDAASTVNGQGRITVAGPSGFVKKTRTLELPAEADALRVSATGIPQGGTIRVNWVVSTPGGLKFLERAGAADRGIAATGTFNLTSASPSIDLGTVLPDALWELDEQMLIEFTYTVTAGTVDKFISTVDRVHYLIYNDDPETAGALVHYDFDRPNAADGYDFTKTPSFISDPKVTASPLKHTGETPRPNRSLRFDGVNDFVRIDPTAALPRNPLTFEFWMHPGGVTGIEHVVALGGENRATVYVNSTGRTINMRFTQFNIDVPIGTYTANRWHHVAITHDGSTIRGYVNGALGASRPASGNLSFVNNLVHVGTFDEVTDRVFTGMVDELRIWSVARTQSAIRAGSDDHLVGGEAGLFAYYRFDEGSGVFADDATGNDHLALLGPSQTGRDPAWTATPPESFIYGATLIEDVSGLPKIQPSHPQVAASHAASHGDWNSEGPWVELLGNGGNEDGVPGRPIGRWTAVKGTWLTPDPAALPLAPLEGIRLFDVTSVEGELSQVVDVSRYAAFIDAGAQEFDFRAYVQSAMETNPDSGRIVLEYRDERGQVIQTFDGGDRISLRTWDLVKDRRLAPRGTRSIRVRLIATPHANGDGSNDVFFDHLSLRALENDRYYSFTVVLADENGPLAPDDYRMSFSGLRLFGKGATGGPERFLVFSSLDGFAEPIASGGINSSEFTGGVLPLSIGCLRPDHTPIEFRIFGLGADGAGSWTIDNLTLMGSVHPRGLCNEPPEAANDSAETLAAQPVNINVIGNDTDLDADPLTVVSFTQAANGTVTDEGDGVLRYTPAAGFVGTDSFSYTVSDGHGGTDTAVVTIKVLGPPVANNDTVTVPEDTTVTFGVIGNDLDPLGNGLAITSHTQPGHGSLTLNANGTFTYTPGANRTTDTSFQYTVRDSANRDSTATVTLDLQPANDPPVANNDSAATKQNVNVTINVRGNDSDPDGDSLSITSFTQPAGAGAVTAGAQPGTLVFDPAPTFLGNAVFTYTISDGHGGTDTAAVTVTVTQNHPPVAVDEFIQITAFGSFAFLSVLANDSDPDGDSLTITAASLASGGGTVSIGLAGTSLQYTYGGFRGTATINYTISDGFGGTDTGTATVEVKDLNPTGASPVAVVAVAEPAPTPVPATTRSQPFARQVVRRPRAGRNAEPDTHPLLTTAAPRPAAAGPVGAVRLSLAKQTPFSNRRTVSTLLRDSQDVLGLEGRVQS